MLMREFKAKIKPDFKSRWMTAMAKRENTSTQEIESIYMERELDLLAQRISGQVVDLLEYTYPKQGKQIFEKLDNGYLIFPELFEELYTHMIVPTKDIGQLELARRELLKMLGAESKLDIEVMQKIINPMWTITHTKYQTTIPTEKE